ncbi:MAG: DUF3298 domain-containing protein [Candidatus Uhrbacteria bacterium]
MNIRPLSLILITLSLAGIGCATKPTIDTTPIATIDTQQAYTKTLSGTTENAKLTLSITSAFGKVRGSFIYTENSSSTTGIVFGNTSDTKELLFGFYTGQWDEFANATGTWQDNTLNLDIARTAKAPTKFSLTQTKDTGAKISVTTASGSDKRTDGTERCTFNFAYPVLENENANTIIKKEFGLGATTTPQLLANEFIARCKTDIEDLLSNTTTADYAKDAAYDSETLFSVERNRDQIISFLIDSYDFEGGAHGMPGIYGVNINLESGTSLALGDIIKRDSLKPFMQKIEKQLLAEYTDALFEEPLTEFKKFIADKKPATEAELVTFAGHNNFYLTNSSIVFYWNVYEISPYAAGQLTVEVPFSEIRDMLRSDAPGSTLTQ